MADDVVPLAGEFPPVSYEQWRVAVDALLKGRDFADLRSVTPDGIVIEPLYSAGETSQAQQFSRPRGSRPGPRRPTREWDVRQHHTLTTASATNAAILTDLQRGVTSIELDTSGLGDVAALDAVLAEVSLDVAPVALASPDDGVDAAQWFLELAQVRGIDAKALLADLGCDPIGRLAATGRLASSPQDSIDRVARFAIENASRYPLLRSVRANGAPYANAGASPATEVATTVATAVAYVRAMTSAGLDTADAFDQVLMSLTIGTDQFGDIAKLRALRILWFRLAELSGVPGSVAVIQGTTAASTLSNVDPWTNMLRVTVSCVAAAVGGADIITIQPFDAAIGVPSELGMRIARNTQLALMEESGLHRVTDPAGGSWYVEDLTDRLAEEAWAILQDLEGNGGVVASVLDGSLRQRIDHTWESTRAAVADGDRAIVGVSHFPDHSSKPLERAPYPQAPPPSGTQILDPLPVRRLADAFVASSTDADGGAT